MSQDKEKNNDRQTKDDFLELFGERLKDVRQQLRLLQKDFAAGLDVSGSFLSEIEKGKANPGFDVLKKIYINYNVNIHYLMDGHGEPFVNREEKGGAASLFNLTGPDKEKLQELLFYIENAPVVRYAIYEFFSTYLYKNKGMVEEDMNKHKAYLRKQR